MNKYLVWLKLCAINMFLKLWLVSFSNTILEVWATDYIIQQNTIFQFQFTLDTNLIGALGPLDIWHLTLDSPILRHIDPPFRINWQTWQLLIKYMTYTRNFIKKSCWNISNKKRWVEVRGSNIFIMTFERNTTNAMMNTEH